MHREVEKRWRGHSCLVRHESKRTVARLALGDGSSAAARPVIAKRVSLFVSVFHYDHYYYYYYHCCCYRHQLPAGQFWAPFKFPFSATTIPDVASALGARDWLQRVLQPESLQLLLPLARFPSRGGIRSEPRPSDPVSFFRRAFQPWCISILAFFSLRDEYACV